jgi:hypothetical protein
VYFFNSIFGGNQDTDMFADSGTHVYLRATSYRPATVSGSGTFHYDDADAIATALTSTTLPSNWDIGSFKITAETLESDIATGTAPLVVASTTEVSNLNAEQVGGFPPTQTGEASKVLATDASARLVLGQTGSEIYIEPDEETADGQGVRARLGLELADYSNQDHFTAFSGYTWAGAPFITPGTATIVKSRLDIILTATSDRAFAYVSAAPSSSMFVLTPSVFNYITGGFTGVRCDDGTDDNYVEIGVVKTSNAPDAYTIRMRWQIAAGGVNTRDGAALSYFARLGLKASVSGTQWSSWGMQPYLISECGSIFYQCTALSGLTWTPTRLGLTFDAGASTWASWHHHYVDAFGY